MTRRIFAVAIAATLLLSACSISPGDKVGVTMREWSLKVSPSSVRSGRVRFAIDSLGDAQMDMALIQAKDLAEVKRTPDGKLDLTGAFRPIDEIKPFEPGHYIATSPNLAAGHYLVICRLHADQGMVANLTIVPRKKKTS
jgi:hypothetical protein